MRPVELLGLGKAAIAIGFFESPPPGVPRWEGGPVAAGCVFWEKAMSGQTFYTVASDHYNCAVGSYTHKIPLPAERAHELNDTIVFMAQNNYVATAEVPGIPTLAKSPGAVAYGPMDGAGFKPDVVLIAAKPAQAMLIYEAAIKAGAGSAADERTRSSGLRHPAADDGKQPDVDLTRLQRQPDVYRPAGRRNVRGHSRRQVGSGRRETRRSARSQRGDGKVLLAIERRSFRHEARPAASAHHRLPQQRLSCGRQKAGRGNRGRGQLLPPTGAVLGPASHHGAAFRPAGAGGGHRSAGDQRHPGCGAGGGRFGSRACGAAFGASWPAGKSRPGGAPGARQAGVPPAAPGTGIPVSRIPSPADRRRSPEAASRA